MTGPLDAVPECRTLRRPDGRCLAWSEFGRADGPPVLYFHGFPGSRLEVAAMADLVAASGVRLIAIDRPGFGRSDEQPGRTFLDWPAEVCAVADELALERFACVGVSGGGPYALACAHDREREGVLAERLTAATVVCGLGPLDDRRGKHGMFLPNRLGLAFARGPRVLVRMGLAPLCRAIRRDPARVLARLVAGLPAPDRAVFEDEERARLMAASLAEAVRQGPRPLADELGRYARPWGFRLEDIRAAITFHQGDADVTVPPAMARLQAERVPRGAVRTYPGEGHYSLLLRHVEPILAELVRA